MEVFTLKYQYYFGLAIKKIRNSKNISQEKFSLQIGMDRTYYASIESGNRNVSINNIGKIADGFSLSLSELFKVVDEIRNEYNTNLNE